MAIYIYSPTVTQVTRQLVEALNAKLLVKHDGMNFVYKGKPLAFDATEDRIICLGAFAPPIGKVKMFNSSLQFTSELALNLELPKIPNTGFRIMEYYKIRLENPLLPTTFVIDDINWGRMVPSHTFIGYGAMGLSMQHEYELHVMNGKVIRVGKKTPTRPIGGPSISDTHAHKWFKSEAAGWTTTYDANTKLVNLKKDVINFVQNDCGLDYAIVYLGCHTVNGEVNPDYPRVIRKVLVRIPENPAIVKDYITELQTWIAGN